MLRRIPILLVLALVACAEPPTSIGDDADPSMPLASLVVFPKQGPPASFIEVRGSDATVLAGEISLTVGGRPTSVRVAEGGRLVAAVPVFMDGSGSVVEPPTDPLDVTLYRDGVAVAEAPAVFVVTPLPVAPGAVSDVSDALQSVVGSLREVSLSLEPAPSVEQAYAVAALDAVEALLTGDDPSSLATQLALLEQREGGEQELIEGILAASGLLDQLGTVAELATRFSAALKATSPPTSLERVTELTDFELASRMQLYVMVHEFGAQVLGATATEWGNTVGLAAGAAGLVTSIPMVGTVTAALSVASFAINNVALAYLPARIDSFELVLGQPFVFSGEPAQAEVWIQASNAPPSITVLDLTDLVLTGMGLAAGAERETIRGIITSVADFYLARVRSLLTAYGQAHPDADIALDVASIPTMTWRARVTDARYVTPGSFTPELIDANGLGLLGWRAAIDAAGEGRIYAAVNTGPEALAIPLIPGYEYNAGAFGTDIRNTETASVEVGPPLVVAASMDDVISEGGTNGLEIRAGTRSALGDTLWQAGLAVSVTATGGSVDPATGLTGQDGRFDTFITLAPGSDSVSVGIAVTAANGFQAETSVSAASGGHRLDLSFVERLAPGDSAEVVVVATVSGASAEPIALEFNVDGGWVNEWEATLQPNTPYTTWAHMDDGENELVIEAVARLRSGATLLDTVSALRPNEISLGDRDSYTSAQVLASYRPDSTSAWIQTYFDEDSNRNDDAVGPTGVFEDSIGASGNGGWASGAAHVIHRSEVALQAEELTLTFESSAGNSSTVSQSAAGIEWTAHGVVQSILNVDLAVWGDSAQYSLEVDVGPGVDLSFGQLGICYEDGVWCGDSSVQPGSTATMSGTFVGRHRFRMNLMLFQGVGAGWSQSTGTASVDGSLRATLRIWRPGGASTMARPVAGRVREARRDR